MRYKALTADHEDDILASFVLAQERDHFCHEINEQRYLEMLPTLPDGAFKSRIEKLLEDTRTRKTEVEAILEKTHKQVEARNPARFDAAIERVRAQKPMRGN